jgi:hypothetical protein
MTVILHPPGDVSFSGDALSAEDQARISRVVHAAVLRALEKAATSRGTRSVPSGTGDHPGGRDAGEAFDPARADPARSTYLVPSYRDAGQLTGVQLLELIPKAAPGYAVGDGPTPVEGALVMILQGDHYVHLGSPRYATAGTLTQAVALGLAIFGSTSFAILQGPLGSPKLRYWAVGTNPGVSHADLGREVTTKTEEGKETLPPELAGRAGLAAGEALLPTVKGSDGEYLARGLVTRDRIVHWRGLVSPAAWYAQLEDEQRQGVTAPPVQEFRRLVFAEVDRLVAEIEGGNNKHLERAAELLSRMDRVAFGLVDWETKVSYLKVLLAAWTGPEEETAVVQIFASLENGKEVDAVVALLKQAGRYDQLFDDLDSELYDLLITVGERFPRDHGPLTVAGFIQLLQSMGVVPKKLREALLGTVLGGPDDVSVPEAVLDQAYDAVAEFIHFGERLGESLITLVTEPSKVIESLARMLVKVTLAELGDPQAVQEIGQLLAGLAEKVLAGMRGADRLGCGEKVMNKVKWRLVWEIAALFVGPGEVKAVIQGAGLAEKLAGVVRFLGILARAGEAAEAGTEGVRLARLAAMLKAERAAFASVEEAAELLSRLPDADVTRLGKLLSSTEIREGETLAELAARSQALGFQATLDDAIGKAGLLKAMAAKAGGLTDEITEAFHLLIGPNGLELADAEGVVAAIGAGEGARFAAVLRRMPLGWLAADARAAFLEVVAASPTRMEAVAELGTEAFAAVYQRAAGRGEVIDEHLAALQEAGDRLAGKGNAAEFRRLLDRLEQDDPAAWLEVENARRLRAGERAISDWVAAVSGSPRAQRGLDLLLQRGHEDLVAEIMDSPDQLSIVHQLERASELTPKQLDGLAAIMRAEVDFGEAGIERWNDILDLHPAFRDPLLDLVADVSGTVDDGLDLAIKRAFAGGQNVQGSLGHFYAVRTLRDRFPGARFRLEVGEANREIDIQMSYQGRRIDVEVKTNLGRRPSIDNSQIEKDLGAHIGDRWDDMLYLYAPQQAGNLASVERAMLRALERLDAAKRLPMPLPDAEQLLRDRFADDPPWKLVDTFTY